jgi:streptogramin lyase
MKAGLLSLVACCACWVASLAVSPVVAMGEGSSSESSQTVEGSGASMSLDEGLVTPGSPTQREQAQAAEEAKRDSPEAVVARESSRTEFENLDEAQARKEDATVFPGLIDEPAGGPPKLPVGQSIAGFVTDDAAQIVLPEGKHAVLESFQPIALETSGGGHVPVDLSLSEAGGAFEPKTPIVPVRIPKQLGIGVSLGSTGVSLTPVDSSGAPLGGSEGALQAETEGASGDASVVYANTQTDADTVVKPGTYGFAEDTILRSVESPSQLYYKVGLPEGASLVAAKDGSGAVEVVKEGATIATILPPGAHDAAGTTVPVSMGVSGDTLTLSVEDHSREYLYPLEVDPEVKGEDSQLVANGSKRSNWEFYTSNGKGEPSANFASNTEGGILKTYGAHEYKEGEAAFWVYQTRGVSKIYEFNGETEGKNKEDRIESIVELQHEGGVTEEKELLSNETTGPVEYAKKTLPEPLCPKGKESCVPTSGNKENAVHFQQSVVNKPASNYSFSDAVDSGTVYISEPEIENGKKEKEKIHSTTGYNSSSPGFEIEIENSKKEKEKQKRNNALYGSSNWLSEYDGAIQFTAKDPGIGIAKSWLEYENSGKWEVVSGSEHNYLEEGLCKGVQCESEQKEYWTLNKHLPNGEDKIRYRAEEAFGDATHETESLETEGVGTVKVDTSKPHSIYLGGLPFANELSEKAYKVTAYATDGEGSTIPSSGIASLAVFIENSKGEKKEIAKTGGSGECSTPKGECTASAEYTINGAELGAGHHGIVIVAKDNAGNEGREEEQVSVRHSTPVPMGPGDVDLESGDFTLGPTDVSLGGGLSVSRVYSSRDLTAGVEGGSLLGPQWSLSVGSEESLVEMVDKSVLVTSGNGGQTVFAAMFNSKGEPTGKFEAPPGDSNLTMTLEENEKKEKVAYYLKDPAAGTSTKFILSSTAKVWVPTVQEGPVPTDTVSYFYETVEVGGKKVTRPSEERGATPAKVSCAPKMEPGCRALKFTYATKTNAGEKESSWDEYEGRLSKISYEGYNPSTKKMTETPIPVVEYSYDSRGRLRAEWDPRISPVLKTMYGYDEEGHVTALDPPGQEPWAFTYGTIAGDAGTGRLLKVGRAPASAGLWDGKSPINIEAPKLEGTTLIGARIGVSSVGAWSNSPMAYTYQWEDCNSKGESCTPIVGAVNADYTLTATDVGHTIVAQVSAINGGGSAVANTTVSAEVKALETEYTLPEEGYPEEIVEGPENTLWFANANSKKIGKITTSGTITEYPLPGAGQVQRITEGTEGDMWFTTTDGAGAGKIGKITPSGTITEYALSSEPSVRKPYGITTGPEGNLWFTVGAGGGPKAIGKITPSGAISEYPLSWESPYAITTGPDGNIWFTVIGVEEGAIGKLTIATGRIEEYHVAKVDSAPFDITPGRDNNLWFTNDNSIGKITTSGSITEYPLPETYKYGGTYDITEGPEHNMWFTIPGGPEVNSRLGTITPSGAITEILLPKRTEPRGITTGADGNIWMTEYGPSKIGKVNLAHPSQSELYGPQPGTTIDYNVPVSGSGAPHNMSASEVAKWGQKAEEAPEEATAIFPPDSPQSWPVTNSASATYSNSLGSEGTGNGQLEMPFGMAINTSGDLYVADYRNKRVEEFSSTGKYLAQLGAEGSEGALSGPEGVAVDSKGNIWVVDADADDVEEFSSSGAYLQKFGSTGHGNGQLFVPRSIAVGANGDLYVVDSDNNRVEEFSTTGEYLGQFGSEGSGNGQFKQPVGIVIAGGNVYVSDFSNDRVEKFNEKGEYLGQFGSKGTGNGQFNGPNGVAVADGVVYVVDEGNSRVEEFNEKGEYLGQFGSNGTGSGQFEEPWDIVTNSTGSVWVTDTVNDRVEKWLTPSGSYTRATVYYLDGQGRLVNTATPSTGTYGSISTTEYNETNDIVRTLTPDNREAAIKEGCESESNCASAKKAKLLSTENTYNGEGEKESEVAEPGTRLILSRGPEHTVKYTAGEEHYEPGEKAKESMARSFTKYFYNEGAPAENPRTKKKETYDLATRTQNYAELINKEGVGSETTDVRETKTSYSGQDDLGWKLRAPTSVTNNPGSLNQTTTTEYYENEASETFGQVKETRGPGAEGTFTYASKFGESGSEAGKFNSPFAAALDSEGNIWVADTGNNRIEKFGPEGKYISTFGKAGSEAGELKEPKSIAIYKGDIWVAESGNDRIQEFSPEGKSLLTFGKAGSGNGELKEPKALAIDSHGNVWVADTGNNRIEEFNEKGSYVSMFGKAGSGLGELKEPRGIAIDSKGNIWVSDTGNNRIQEFNTEGKLLAHFGESGSGAGQFKTPFDLTFDASGHLWVVDEGDDRIEELSSSGAFITQFGWKGSEPGQLNEPRGLAIDAKGDVWVVDTANSRLEEWSKGANAHDAKTVYYTLEENKEGYPECGKHPEWAGLVCKALPAKQPELAGLPKLPVTTSTYNIWDEPETIEETFGSGAEAKKRTTKEEYDPAGRMTGSEETSTATTETTDRTLPKVTEEYNSTTGLLEKQSTKVGETTKTIASAYNTLGQIESYTDSDGNTAKFKYAGPENDGLLEEMSDDSDEGLSNQKYTYNTTTKQLETLVDSAAGTLTASYDTEGKLTSEVYPNGMCANYTYNSIGEATRVAYLKTTNCSEKEPGIWYSDERVPSIRGEMMSQTSTLASETYSYDQSGRLTEVQETPAGEGCTTRLYAYEESSNRTSLTTRKPGSEGKCATEGGTVTAHDYDEANRLTDSGIEYDPLGNVTKLPSGDAEGHALESTFYVDNAVATQTQNGVTNDYYMDPDGRVRETITGAKKVITHYDGSSEAVAWTCEGAEKASACESGGKWTRDIPGIDGTLTAVQNGTGAVGETPILQLHDLQGDVVATIKDKIGETKLESTYNSTEFGAPNGKEPPKFAWLGAEGVEKSLSSGVITYGATSYVPQTGRALQSEEVLPPGLPDGSGGQAASFTASAWNLQGAERVGAEAPGKEAGREREAAEAAIRATLAATEDPEGLLTWQNCDKLAEQFKEWSEAIIEAIGPKLEGSGAFGVPGLLFEEAEIESHEAFKLEACASQVKGEKPYLGLCWVQYKPIDQTFFDIGTFNLVPPAAFQVEACPWVNGHKKHHEVFNCAHHGLREG